MFSEHPYKIGLDMLMQEKYSDLSIICQGVEFKVHRAIVCPRSPMLEAACGGQFKVNDICHKFSEPDYS